MDKEQILKQYLESTFYEKYKETYVSDKILREFIENMECRKKQFMNMKNTEEFLFSFFLKK